MGGLEEHRPIFVHLICLSFMLLFYFWYHLPAAPSWLLDARSPPSTFLSQPLILRPGVSPGIQQSPKGLRTAKKVSPPQHTSLHHLPHHHLSPQQQLQENDPVSWGEEINYNVLYRVTVFLFSLQHYYGLRSEWHKQNSNFFIFQVLQYVLCQFFVCLG